MRFYLGTHRPNWLAQLPVPLMISYRQLMKRKRLPRALGPWVLDSSAYTEVLKNGCWRLDPSRYAESARRYVHEIGNLEWAAIQDWPCERQVLKATGLTIGDHQARTIESWFVLNSLAPDVPWIPVLQGWLPSDYLNHAAAYVAAGVNLKKAPRVGVGTMCRRDARMTFLHYGFLYGDLRRDFGLENLHIFGLKATGLRSTTRDLLLDGMPMIPVCGLIASTDSAAWSYGARMSGKDPNSMKAALEWRWKLLSSLPMECLVSDPTNQDVVLARMAASHP